MSWRLLVFKVLAGALFALITAGSASAQESVIWKENVHGWRVAVDRTIDNSCFIITRLANDQYMRLQINSVEAHLQVIVANPTWSALETGRGYAVEISFDEPKSWPVEAIGHKWQNVLPSLVLSFPLGEHETRQFLNGVTSTRSLNISYQGSEIAALALPGVEGAVASMLDCQEQMARFNQEQESGDDPFGPAADEKT